MLSPWKVFSLHFGFLDCLVLQDCVLLLLLNSNGWTQSGLDLRVNDAKAMILIISIGYPYLDLKINEAKAKLIIFSKVMENPHLDLRINTKAPPLLPQLHHLLLHPLCVSVSLHQTLKNNLYRIGNWNSPTWPAWMLRRSTLQTPHCANLDLRGQMTSENEKVDLGRQLEQMMWDSGQA